MNNVNYYDLLGVKQTAALDEIKAAYRRQAMKYHPDRNNGSKQAEEQFKKINIAYECLSNPLKRDAYDMKLRAEQNTNTYNNYYQSTYEQNFYEGLTKDEQILKNYIARVFSEDTLGKEQLKKYLQELRLSTLPATMPRLHYLMLMFVGYALLQDNKWVPFFVRDIKDVDACIRIINLTFPKEFIQSEVFLDLFKKTLYFYQTNPPIITGAPYTYQEWIAFGKELHGHEKNAYWSDNLSGQQNYANNYNSQANAFGKNASFAQYTKTKARKKYDFDDDDEDDNDNSLKIFGYVCIAAIIISLCIVYWKQVLIGLLCICIIISGLKKSNFVKIQIGD